MSLSLSRCLDVVLAHEGGGIVADDPRDPGGLTRWGISQRSYPDVDIRSLSREQAEAIYRQHYWVPIRGDDLHPAVALCVLDAAVNQGCGYAARTLQRAAGVTADGVIGPQTLRAVRTSSPAVLVRDIQSMRLDKYLATKHFETFGRGWLRRCLHIALTAQEWTHG